MARNYSNTAPPVSLTVAATSGATTLTVASTTGYPAAPFLIGLERGTANEEVVLCTATTATTFTVTRGYDGTSAKAHAIGTSVEHTVAAIDYREATGPRTIRVSHTFAIPGDILAASGTDNVIPGFFISVPAFQTATLVAVRHRADVAGSSITLNRNGAAITGYSAIAVGATATTTDPADVGLSNDDYISLAATSGGKNLSVTVFIDYTSVI